MRHEHISWHGLFNIMDQASLRAARSLFDVYPASLRHPSPGRAVAGRHCRPRDCPGLHGRRHQPLHMLTNVAMKEAYDEVKVLHTARSSSAPQPRRQALASRPVADKDKEPQALSTHGGLKPPTPKRT